MNCRHVSDLILASSGWRHRPHWSRTLSDPKTPSHPSLWSCRMQGGEGIGEGRGEEGRGKRGEEGRGEGEEGRGEGRGKRGDIVFSQV